MTETAPLVFPTLLEIKREIPSSCFESSTARSLFFAARAFTFAALLIVLLYTLRQIDLIHQSILLDAFVCLGYITLQGFNFWGLFTIGHDCGHGAFSRYHSVNFIIGVLTHSMILTPYEAWKLSHRLHHKNTGNIDQDEIFYPNRMSHDNKPSRQSVLSLGFAWMLYVIMGFPLRTMAHEELRDVIFARNLVTSILSIIGHLTCVIIALMTTYTYGMNIMGLYYWSPLLVFATMLVITTFLHHNDEETPWYADSEWTYVKGNLSSVDRSYGWLINHMSHNIGTHQVHHLFPIIPHYNLVEATIHFRKAFPHLVRQSDEPIVSAFFTTLFQYIKYGVCADDVLVFSLKQCRQMTFKNE